VRRAQGRSIDTIEYGDLLVDPERLTPFRQGGIAAIALMWSATELL
jgi:hypothetical protein